MNVHRTTDFKFKVDKNVSYNAMTITTTDKDGQTTEICFFMDNKNLHDRLHAWLDGVTITSGEEDDEA
jgi:hypothetical protein